MMVYTLPFISALVGWLTNWIAVKMLFRPRNKIKILFFEIQGIFPKRQQQVAEKIGKMVAEELLSAADVRDLVSHPENLAGIVTSLEGKVDEYLHETFPIHFPFASLFVTRSRKKMMKDAIIVEVERIAPEMVHKYMDRMEQSFNVEKVIREKVALLPPDRLETMIMSILKKEFQFIEWIGAFIGFVIGLIQVLLVSL